VPELLDEVEIVGALRLLNRIIEQDTEPGPLGGYRIKKGVAPDRVISISDPDMRHGRKSSSQVVKGYKRFDVCDLDSGLTLCVCVLPANMPEAVARWATTSVRRRSVSRFEKPWLNASQA
jgi:hypothetical protein